MTTYVLPGVEAGNFNNTLTDICVAYRQEQSRFIADSAFPVVPVSKQAGNYFKYDRGYFNSDEMQLRAPGTESNGMHYTIDNSPSYACREWSLHNDVPVEVIANQSAPIDAFRDASQALTLKYLIRKERLWAEKYFAGSIWANDFDGVNTGNAWGSGTVLQWNDANSTPIEDIRKASTTILQSTGFEPNILVLGKEVWDQLVDHPDLIERIKYGATPGAPAIVSRQAIAAMFEIDQVLVMGSIVNTAKEAATNAHSFIGGKKALLAYRAPAAGVMTPSAGYTFEWNGPGVQGGLGVRDFPLIATKSHRIEINAYFDQQVVCSDLGFFFDTIVA